ncbi:MFS family permease [Crossiella equi]|uniref:MFS family permease n=1 Tax=Crossiella equi TaxID=130796 RepID=A0ABS5AQ47_9PSEU|nr:MFS transporter [Crossiella equi]MBP2478693.1 MFS family permease [Crossiella equi]
MARTESTRHLVVLVALAPLLANADAGIVALATPDLQRDLGLSFAGAHWVTTVYVLLVGGLQLLGGRLGDVVGPRRLFLSSLLAFGFTSLACGLAPSGELLIAARAGQAVAAAALVPAAMSIMIAAADRPVTRAKALALWAAVAGIGSVAGVLVGGLVVTGLSWRWAFLLNVPVVAWTYWRSRVVCPPDRATERARLDVASAFGLTGGLLALVYGLVRIPQLGGDAVTLTAFAAAALALAGFAARQLRARNPLLPPSVLRDRGLVLGSAGILCVSAATAPVVFLGGLYLQQVHGMSALAAGWALLPMVAGVMVVGRSCARLLATRGPRPPYVLGVLLTAAGLLLLSGLARFSSYTLGLLPGLVLVGLGLPMVWMAAETAALAKATGTHLGLATGVVQSAGQIGSALGLAIAVTLASTDLSVGIGPAFLVAALLLLPALLAAGLGVRPQPAGWTSRQLSVPSTTRRPG